MCNCGRNNIDNVIKIATVYAKATNTSQIVYLSQTGTYNYITFEFSKKIIGTKLKKVNPDGTIQDL